MEIKVPALAENVTTGTVVKIFVSEGERVCKGQDLLELETEKAVAALPSPEDGQITKIHVKEGDEIKVGQVIFSLSPAAGISKKKGEKAKPSLKEELGRKKRVEAKVLLKEEPRKEKGVPAVTKAGLPLPASPSIRKFARELGIDLSRIRGTGPGGRILIDDLKASIEKPREFAVASKAEEKPIRKMVPAMDFSKWGPIHKQPMSALRKKISEAMSLSWTTIPHVTQFDEGDVSSLTGWTKKYGPEYEAQGTRLTLTVIVMKALVPVLKKYPAFNSSLDENTGEIIFKDYYHFGIAVDTEQGLIVPVIRDCDKKGIFELSKELTELAEKTRQRKVSLEELQGGTFTISNQGGIGGAHFTPIIHSPEAAILGLGRAVLKPTVINKKMEPRIMLPLSLSYDHRVIDGAHAARFIRDLREGLENFKEEVLKLPRASQKKKSRTSKK